MPNQVLGLGAAAMDMVLQCENLPREDGFSFVHKEQLMSGGSCANVLVALTSLGIPASLVAAVGDDNFGSVFQEELSGAGVDTKYVKIRPGGTTLHTYVVVDVRGARSILVHMGNCLLSLQESEVDAAMLEKAGVYCTDMFPAKPALKLARLAREKGIPVVFVLECAPSFMELCGITIGEIEQMLSPCDLFCAGREALLEYAGETDARVTGAPLVIGDGLRGMDYRVLKSCGIMGEVKVGAAIYDADKLVVLSHFKGHEDTGFGGALKNLGVGAVARPGKLKLHSKRKPDIDAQLCTRCGRCLQTCPSGAVRQLSGEFVISDERCNICGDCLASCPRQAIFPCFDLDSADIQERLGDACSAVLGARGGQAFFINFLMEITPVCDCRSFSPVPVVGDIGMLAGKDPLAVEQASIDLVKKAIKRKRSALPNRICPATFAP